MSATSSTTDQLNVKNFFNNPENIKMIKKNQEYSKKISDYVKEHIVVKSEVLNTPFGPIDGSGDWSHESR